MTSTAGSPTPSARRVARAAVVTHGKPGQIGSGLARLQAVAQEHGVELVLSSEEAEKHGLEGSDAATSADLAVVLGGDGTVLRALARFLGTGVPVIGVNFGRVGFLSSMGRRDLEDGLGRVFAGEYEVVELPTLERPKGVPERFDEHVKLMYELQWLAFRADITRVVTFMLGRDLNFRTYPEVGVTEGHHGLSHHADRPEQILKYSKVGTLQAQLFAWFLQKLHDTPEGDGSLLDHSVFLYGAGLSNPNTHSHSNLPLTIVGGSGSLQGGRHVVFPRRTPVTNLLLTVLDNVGVHAESLGDSTGRLPTPPAA